MDSGHEPVNGILGLEELLVFSAQRIKFTLPVFFVLRLDVLLD
jgi:hypothetical protein